MCLAIPSKIIQINHQEQVAIIDTLGVQREASLSLMDEEVNIGDYVLLHIGFIMSKIDEKQAKESLELYKQIVDSMEEELK